MQPTSTRRSSPWVPPWSAVRPTSAPLVRKDCDVDGSSALGSPLMLSDRGAHGCKQRTGMGPQASWVV